MTVSSSSFHLSSLLSLLLLLPTLSSANEGNILITGDVLPTDGQLSVPNAVFVIQGDCNLVLYNKGSGFQSNTHGLGSNCTLTLSNNGQLIINKGDGTVVWSSPSIGLDGEYAAILQPDGQIGIYGPSVWSTPVHYSQDFTLAADDDAGKLKDAGKLIENEPNVPNLLFSSEVLNEKSKLVSRDFAFEVKEDCGLEFTKASVGVVWKTPKKTTNKHCFMRLNFRGQLALLNDSNKILWITRPAHMDGVYVLVVKINGQATIYGPRFWSTA